MTVKDKYYMRRQSGIFSTMSCIRESCEVEAAGPM